MKVRYEYDTEEAYYIEQCARQTEFARAQVQSQLESALKRQKDLVWEARMFGGTVAVFVVLFLLGCLLSLSGAGFYQSSENGIWGYFGAVAWAAPFAFLVVLCIAFFLVAMPFFIFRMVRALIVLGIDRQNALGRWLVRKLSFPVYDSEIKKCRYYLNQYDMLSRDLENWREDLAEGIPVDIAEMKRRGKSVNYKPDIPVTQHNYGTFKRISMVAAVVLTVLIYCLLFYSARKAYSGMMDQLVELFRQL